MNFLTRNFSKRWFLPLTVVIGSFAFLMISCEKINPVSEDISAEVNFTCESCHISETLLKLLAPEGEETAGGGG